MISISHKAKQFLVLAIKLLIVGGAFYFIYSQLANNDKFDWDKFQKIIFEKLSFGSFVFILFLSFLNRFLEVLKWQNLVETLRKISVGEAAKQVLGSLTAGFFTPNGIGEFAGKALFYEKSKAKKIVFLNLISNGIQFILTAVFGIFGLLYFNANFNVITPKMILFLFGILILVSGILFFVKKITFKGYSIERLIHKMNELPKKVHQKNILLGIGRYLVFSHQYYYLLLVFDVQAPYLLLMSAITGMYVLVLLLPTFQFLDFAVKGTAAIFLLGLLGVNEWIVVFITTLTWFLNLVLPVIIGSYFVLNYKAKWKS